VTASSVHKDMIRKRALGRRDALSPDHRIELSIAAAESASDKFNLGAQTIVAGFFPIHSEIDPRPLMEILRQRGARLALPVVLDATTIIFRELTRECGLVDTGFGTKGPGAGSPQLDPGVILVPLAAFDGKGNRIGYGAGYYDRAIANMYARALMPKLVGMAFCVQEEDQIPAESHDIPLNAIITEHGYRIFEEGS